MEVKSPIIEFVLKTCDVQLMKNYSDDFYGPMRSNDTKSDFANPLGLVFTIFGLIFVLFSNFHLDREKSRSQLLFLLNSPALKEFLYIVSCLCASLVFMPFTLLIGMTFKIYREYVRHHLMKDKSLRFVDFMSGEDTVWVCENDKSKSIINVLAFVSSNNEINENLPQQLLQSIRARIFAKLVLVKRFPKLFYRRMRDASGYYYWTDNNNLSLNDYVRNLKNFNEPKAVMSEDVLRRRMSEICNNPMPAANSALWECLISQQAVKIGDDIKYPVVFRVHHSVGDGVALLRLFLETLADKTDIKIENNPLLSDMRDSAYLRLLKFISTLYTIIKTPSVLCSQLRKEIDYNQIHPTELTGRKKINWIYESEIGATPLLTVVKLLKRNFPGSRFSNILLAALSKSLRDFFERKRYDIPKEMTVVIPARLYNMQEDPKLRMENKFSVALQTMPIDVSQTNDRVKKIQNCSDIVVASPDYQINYFMMSVVAAIFPDWVLKAIMYSKHATMAISNLPGPNFTIKINGFEFESVGFFLPNIDQTACGVTILSYDNRLHFGIMADESAVESEEDLGMILNGMVDELRSMAETFLH